MFAVLFTMAAAEEVFADEAEFMEDLIEDFDNEVPDVDVTSLAEHALAPLGDRRRAVAGCTGLDTSPNARTCVFGPTISYRDRINHIYLGTRLSPAECMARCTRFLAGAEGCCYQKNGGPWCFVAKGGIAKGVMVRDRPGQPIKAVMCNSRNTCAGLSQSPASRFCGIGPPSAGNAYVRLGAWRTGATCGEKCSNYLAGQEGCCFQKTNKAHCFVVKGGASDQVVVARHSSSQLQAIMCPATSPEAGSCPGIMSAPDMTYCGFNSDFRAITGNSNTKGQMLARPGVKTCEELCVEYLNGREGCCLRAKNRSFCFVTVGGRGQGVFVRTMTRAKWHNTQIQAAMCN